MARRKSDSPQKAALREIQPAEDAVFGDDRYYKEMDGAPHRLSRPCLPLNNHPGTFSSRGGVWTKIRLRPFVTCLFVICYFTVAFAMLEYPPTRVPLVMDL